MAEKVNIDDSIDVAPRVEAGEVLKLSEDEQHLANLGYKQGLIQRNASSCTAMVTDTSQSSPATLVSSKTGPRPSRP